MPYIGKSPLTGNYNKLDSITGSFNGSTTAFNLTVGSNALSPVRAETLLVSLNGVIQQAATDYTVSGTQITFTTAPASSDTCFIIAFGEKLDIGTPSDATVTSAKLSGDLTLPGKLTAAGDTAAGDNASIGYTATEGLILTGQGSTSDITIKNDADQNVMTNPTGTQTAAFAGHVTVAGDVTVTGGIIFDDETLDIYDEGTFSPVLRPYTTEFDSVTYDSIRFGRYVIVGHICHFSFSLRTNAITKGSGSGTISVWGLPVVPVNVANHYKVFHAEAITDSFAGEQPSTFQMHLAASGSFYYSSDTTTSHIALAVTDIDTGTGKNWVSCSGVYETA